MRNSDRLATLKLKLLAMGTDPMRERFNPLSVQPIRVLKIRAHRERLRNSSLAPLVR